MSIIEVVERARLEPPFAHPRDPFPDTRYVCKVFDPIAWNRSEVERAFGVEFPPELVTLWNACGGLSLYEDNKFCQSGLFIPAPQDRDLFTLNNEYLEDKADRVLRGDFIFARFWGDRERSLIRCDQSAPDYGRIVIVTEMGPREEWCTAAHSLEEFLVRFMDARGDKYWEYHYKKKVAERATEDLLRSRRTN